jgi:hypothetical protein
MKPGSSLVLAAATLAVLVVIAFALVTRRSSHRVVTGTDEPQDVEGGKRLTPDQDVPLVPRQRLQMPLPSETRPPNEPRPGPPDPARQERLRSAPRAIGNSGKADREIGAWSEVFSERLRRDLPKDLADKVSLGSLDCFQAGCVMAVDFRDDADAGRNFTKFMVGSEAFARWPGPKMQIDNKPGNTSAGEKWCLFRSSEVAKSLLSDE